MGQHKHSTTAKNISKVGHRLALLGAETLQMQFGGIHT